jgi:hypothetical protein
MTKLVSPNAISTLLANPFPKSSSDLPEIFVQVFNLKTQKYFLDARGEGCVFNVVEVDQ